MKTFFYFLDTLFRTLSPAVGLSTPIYGFLPLSLIAWIRLIFKCKFVLLLSFCDYHHYVVDL